MNGANVIIISPQTTNIQEEKEMWWTNMHENQKKTKSHQ